MYGILDNLKDLPLELDLPYEIFATRFSEPPSKAEDEEKDSVDISQYFFVKEFECPVCKAKFSTSVLRDSKLRMLRMDELRPVYRDVEPLCYDIMLCVNCGYATLKDRFLVVSEKQRDAILANIRTNYANFMPATSHAEIDLKQGVERLKYALLTALIKKVSTGERAMLLTKIAWLYKIMKDEENYLYYAKYANAELTKAYQNESFPIFGMSEGVVTFLLARFAADEEDYSTALKFLSNIIVNQNLSTRLRDLARDLKEYVQQQRKDEK
ncbi:MAG: DUF2225 domain-containing protein [Defluviitaleaceae bacterium]|nr:DUF2225 domain-containing protein [Defluviitaleaceae bacterium]